MLSAQRVLLLCLGLQAVCLLGGEYDTWLKKQMEKEEAGRKGRPSQRPRRRRRCVVHFNLRSPGGWWVPNNTAGMLFLLTSCLTWLSIEPNGLAVRRYNPTTDRAAIMWKSLPGTCQDWCDDSLIVWIAEPERASSLEMRGEGERVVERSTLVRGVRMRVAVYSSAIVFSTQRRAASERLSTAVLVVCVRVCLGCFGK